MNTLGHLTMIKILLLGDSSTGKTCTLLRYCNDSYSASALPTIGIDFKIKTITGPAGPIKLQIWDTAGQERFRTITESYYRGSNAVLIIYDITDKETFINAEFWIKQIMKSNQNVIKILVGNKADLSNNRVVSYEEGNAFAKQYNVPFFETSAKTGQSVNDVFETLVNLVINANNKTTMSNNHLKVTSQQPSKWSFC